MFARTTSLRVPLLVLVTRVKHQREPAAKAAKKLARSFVFRIDGQVTLVKSTAQEGSAESWIAHVREANVAASAVTCSLIARRTSTRACRDDAAKTRSIVFARRP
jgi:hypothetical protein